MKLSILIPVYNEEILVCNLLQKVLDIQLEDPLSKEIVIVDDGSNDKTAHVISKFIDSNAGIPIRFIRHARNCGKGAAIRTAIEASVGEILIIQDADLEYDPQDIPAVIEPIVAGTHRVVYGSRILMEKCLGRSGALGLITGKHPHSYVLAYLGGVTITKLVNFFTGACLTDEPTCYKCFHRSIIDGITIENNDFAWEPEITMKILNRGFNICEVPVSYHPRKNAEGKKIHWRDGIKALWTVWKYRRCHYS